MQCLIIAAKKQNTSYIPRSKNDAGNATRINVYFIRFETPDFNLNLGFIVVENFM